MATEVDLSSFKARPDAGLYPPKIEFAVPKKFFVLSEEKI
jgi:hypothetical protein